jgi:glycosyltransferase involved in cell wall biosynthesis
VTALSNNWRRIVEPDSAAIALVLTCNPSEGGKYQYSLSMLDGLCHLAKEGYHIEFVTLDEEIWKPLVEARGFTVHSVTRTLSARVLRRACLALPFGLSLWRWVGRFLDPLPKYLHRIQPRIVYYPAGDSFGYESVLSSVMTIHDLMHRYERRFPEVSEGRLFAKRERHYTRVCKHAQAILVDSEVGKGQVIESYNVDPSKVYALPYVAPVYVSQLQSAERRIAKYRLPERYVFYPAQFWKHKNHVGLIKAIALLKKQHVAVNAVLVGTEKNAKDEVSKMVDRIGIRDQVFLLDYVSNEELLELYRRAVALVMPTFFGPTNIPPLEAFALGCPVIISDIYGIPAQVKDAALLVDPNDVGDIAEKIGLVWNNEQKRAEMIERGHKVHRMWNQQHFNVALSSITEEILEKMGSVD